MQLYALVDYDNIKSIRRERSRDDVLENVEGISERLAKARRRSFPECGEIVVRYYGGWIDVMDRPTSAGHWINYACGKVRGRRHGARITSEVASSLFDCSYGQLRGLYKDGGQKMVDTLITADLMRIAIVYRTPTILYSSDEDMLPGLLAVHTQRGDTCIMRGSDCPEWMNVAIVRDHGVRIEAEKLL